MTFANKILSVSLVLVTVAFAAFAYESAKCFDELYDFRGETRQHVDSQVEALNVRLAKSENALNLLMKLELDN